MLSNYNPYKQHTFLSYNENKAAVIFTAYQVYGIDGDRF